MKIYKSVELTIGLKDVDTSPVRKMYDSSAKDNHVFINSLHSKGYKCGMAFNQSTVT